MIEKFCLKKLEGQVVNMSLIYTDNHEKRVILSTDDDWEASYTGENAEYIFMLLLEEPELDLQKVTRLGLTQYG